MTKKITLPIVLFAIFFIGMAIIQFATPDMPDNDGFYHIKLAWLMRTQGLKPDFPYMPLSILNEKLFYDHHFLFHVALIPFTFGDLRVGAKWAAVVFSAFAFLCVWYLFERQKISYSWLWALALLGISDAFLYRMSITRAQSLSLAVLALGFIFLLEGKYKQLAILSFFYVWMYDAFPLMIALAGLHLFAVLLVERRLEYRPFLWTVGGVLAGLLINPYFPNNLIFTYHHLLPKLLDPTSLSVGNEWFPYDTGQLLNNSLPSLIAFACAVLALGLTGKRIDLRTTLALLSTLLFGYMLFKARRFIEYFPAFALIFTAFAWEPLLKRDTARSEIRVGVPSFLKVNFGVILLILGVAWGIGKSIPATQGSISGSKPYDLYQGAAAWLVQNTPEGSLIFQTDWDDFPRLFFYDTHNVYLAGLDPSYFQIYNPDLYDLWVSITRGAVYHPSAFIRDKFGAEYIHTDLDHGGFLDQAANDPGLVQVYRDTQAVIFKVVEP